VRTSEIHDTGSPSGTVLFVEDDIKPQDQVLAEFLGAESPGQWLVEEVGVYLYPDADEEDRENLLDSVFDRVNEERARFTTTHVGSHHLTEFTLEVEKNSKMALGGTYTSLPSPVLLLELCLKLAEPGDEIHVTHRYASSDACTFSAQWPFGMDWAVSAATPMGEILNDDGEDSEDDEPEYETSQAWWHRLYVLPVVGLLSLGAGLVSGLFVRRSSR